MLETDAEFRVAESHRSLGIKMLAQGKYFRSHQTEEHRKILRKPTAKTTLTGPVPANSHQHHRQNEDRKRLNDVEKTQCSLRYPSHRSPICSLEITSDNAKRRADRNREGGGNDRNEYVRRGAAMSRDSTSMPFSSVPKGCAPFGDTRRCSGSANVGGLRAQQTGRRLL